MKRIIGALVIGAFIAIGGCTGQLVGPDFEQTTDGEGHNSTDGEGHNSTDGEGHNKTDGEGHN